jgi:hypothetical protein
MVYVTVVGGHHDGKWCIVFANGQMWIHSDDCTIWPTTSRIGVNVAQVEELILEN